MIRHYSKHRQQQVLSRYHQVFFPIHATFALEKIDSEANTEKDVGIQAAGSRRNVATGAARRSRGWRCPSTSRSRSPFQVTSATVDVRVVVKMGALNVATAQLVATDDRVDHVNHQIEIETDEFTIGGIDAWKSVRIGDKTDIDQRPGVGRFVYFICFLLVDTCVQLDLLKNHK